MKKQYQSSSNLATRISIHDKYSTNKMGFGNWIFSNYVIADGSHVLELGCGTGDMWVGKERQVNACSRLILSDFSEGMLETAKSKLAEYKKIEYQVIDICDIPYGEDAFDIVIANMMLYHVPDLQKALSEVRRVLKKGGAFYCATYGEHGIIEYLSGLLSEYGLKDKTNKNFTLQNGDTYLKQVFSQVERLEYKDSLAVTDIGDLVDYLYSLTSMTTFNQMEESKIESVLASHMEDGILHVPTDYGMFICR